MARNVEIKARVADPESVRERAAALATGGPEFLEQSDVYFQVPTGRLKLRIFGAGAQPASELIQYQRSDALDPEVSTYQRVPSEVPAELRAALAAALGERVVVRKKRTVYLVGRTRIHLDEVDQLGSFLELEVVLEEDEAQQNGEAEAARLMQQLGVTSTDLIDVGYADLLEAALACTNST